MRPAFNNTNKPGKSLLGRQNAMRHVIYAHLKAEPLTVRIVAEAICADKEVVRERMRELYKLKLIKRVGRYARSYGTLGPPEHLYKAV
jgi:predicted transcriptional regulator